MLTTITQDPGESFHARPGATMQRRLGLALLWSFDEPERSGQVALLPPVSRRAEFLLGRGLADVSSLALRWIEQRPGENRDAAPLQSPRISREQLRVRQPEPMRLELRNVGRCPLLFEDRAVERVSLVPGQCVRLGRVALLMCVERPATLPALDPEGWPGPLHAFGAPDRFGLVGEGPSAWDLRAQLGFVGARAAHVLIRGASGTGKELVAQALHALSPRARRQLVARNAATFPETLLDAELFGNAKNFPNVGMPERPGLIGEADGGTLFLDEFGELPVAAQAHLLRVLDAGEYARLGEARSRRADLRLLAATNRPTDALKEDVLARLRLRLELPGLDRRREDIPMLAAHLLRRLARQDPGVARRCFPDADVAQPPRISVKLMAALVRWPYTTHVRELEALLWRAMSSGTGDMLDVWSDAAPAGPTTGESAEVTSTSARTEPAVTSTSARTESAVTSTSARAESAVPMDATPEPSSRPEVDPLSIPPEELQARLDAHGGRQEPVWRELGFSSRHVLTRLVRRYNLRVRGRTGEDD